MALTRETVKQRLTDEFGDKITNWEETFGMLTCTMPAEDNMQVLQFLYNNEELRFRFLTFLTGVHFPDRKGEELSVVYQLHNLQDNVRIRIKTYLPIEQPDIQTATELFSGANWMERETYDFFGVNFVGHPDLRRILNVDEMEHFPMRKEFPMEDPTRTDKDDEMFGRGDFVV